MRSQIEKDLQPNPEPRIVGGESVNPPNRYPFQVSVVSASGNGWAVHVCGGSLVAPNVVLSAAHCVEFADIVQVGRYDLSNSKENFEQFNVIDRRVHPSYDEQSQDYDFLILQLDGASSFSPVTLNDGKIVNFKNGQDLTVMGWGLQNAGDDVGSSVLKETTVDYISKQDCDKILPSLVSENMFCARRTGTDSCQGDSGGPIITADGTDVQVGIVSWGVGCADPVYPGVYANVAAQYSWIRSYICQWSPDYCLAGNGNDPNNPPGGSSTLVNLETTFEGTNGSSGNMFDVQATVAVQLITMEIHTVSTMTETVELYTKPGTHVGYEQNKSEWTARGQTKVLGRGEGNRTPLPEDAFDPVDILAGETVALYVTLRSANIVYSDTNKKRVGDLYVKNSDVKLFTGIGNAYAFGSMFSPRMWNGCLKYRILDDDDGDYTGTSPIFDDDDGTLERVDRIHMTLVGVSPLDIGAQSAWADVTSVFVHNYYNKDGGTARDGNPIESKNVTTVFVSQDPPKQASDFPDNGTTTSISRGDNHDRKLQRRRKRGSLSSIRFYTSNEERNLPKLTDDEITDYNTPGSDVSPTTAIRESEELSISYAQSLHYVTVSKDVKPEDVATDPFSSSLQRSNYIRALRETGNPAFENLSDVFDVYAEQDDDDANYLMLVIYCAIAACCVVLVAFLFPFGRLDGAGRGDREIGGAGHRGVTTIIDRA
eukprot:CAMPEP_0196808396 /NCGR_PEP_ID=MMETSP1362-20130617/8368_1 /TAXON_ID=163516 /ORGANISM="Leptocylindrus danicus, Strain CCMP1856" /LENGTH=709 /DNA_ID=CAMNT_0042182713 /DNA_START=365 /DNA_END=2492 /DNA_ORIENTATION=+